MIGSSTAADHTPIVALRAALQELKHSNNTNSIHALQMQSDQLICRQSFPAIDRAFALTAKRLRKPYAGNQLIGVNGNEQSVAFVSSQAPSITSSAPHSVATAPSLDVLIDHWRAREREFKATEFHAFRLRRLAFIQWRQFTAAAREARMAQLQRSRERLAIDFDRRIVGRIALSQWKLALQLSMIRQDQLLNVAVAHSNMVLVRSAFLSWLHSCRSRRQARSKLAVRSESIAQNSTQLFHRINWRSLEGTHRLAEEWRIHVLKCRTFSRWCELTGSS